METLDVKLARLEELLTGNVNIIAFSGGIDSTVLVAVSTRVAEHTVAVTFESILNPPGEIEETRQLASSLQVSHSVLPFNIFDHPSITSNPPDRCYNCKKTIISSLKAFKRDYLTRYPGKDARIMEGTNASDLGGHRPGYRALQEEGIMTPLVEVGLMKDELRLLAKRLELPNAGRPSMTCLATRIPCGTPITVERITRISEAEKYLVETHGIRVLRVRDHGDLARIETGQGDLHRLLDPQTLGQIDIALKKMGFKHVTIDAGGYKQGSMVVQEKINR